MSPSTFTQDHHRRKVFTPAKVPWCPGTDHNSRISKDCSSAWKIEAAGRHKIRCLLEHLYLLKSMESYHPLGLFSLLFRHVCSALLTMMGSSLDIPFVSERRGFAPWSSSWQLLRFSFSCLFHATGHCFITVKLLRWGKIVSTEP